MDYAHAVGDDSGGPTPSTHRYRRSRADLRAALDDLIERGHALASSRCSRRHRGSLIRQARRIKAEAVAVVTYTVLAEREAGASWDEIADALALDADWVERHYAPIEEAWREHRGIGPEVAAALRVVE